MKDLQRKFYLIFKIIFEYKISLYTGVLPRTMWMSIGGLIYFGAFEFVTSLFFPDNS